MHRTKSGKRLVSDVEATAVRQTGPTATLLSQAQLCEVVGQETSFILNNEDRDITNAYNILKT
jgi:hypothetical protein